MVWLTRSLARAHPLAHEACARAHTQVPAGDLGHFIEGRSEPEPLAHADGADAEPVRPLLLKGGIAYPAGVGCSEGEEPLTHAGRF